MIDITDIHTFPKGEVCHLSERVDDADIQVAELNRLHPFYDFTAEGTNIFVRPLPGTEQAVKERVLMLEARLVEAEARAAAADEMIASVTTTPSIGTGDPATLEAGTPDAVPKRGPGRPRKNPVES